MPRPRRRLDREAGCFVVLTTVPSLAAAKRLGRGLLRDRLCACVSVVPGLRSLYRWEGKVREEGEVLLIIKTTRGRLPGLEKRLLALHPYQVPELIAWPASHVASAYARWLRDSTS
jgi:periplasmic divalent cation tolerance protein